MREQFLIASIQPTRLVLRAAIVSIPFNVLEVWFMFLGSLGFKSMFNYQKLMQKSILSLLFLGVQLQSPFAFGFRNNVGFWKPGSTPMVMTWNTNNTSTGSSAANQALLPLISGSTYNFVVEWGDGNSDWITAWNDPDITHTYSASGTYTIKLIGRVGRLTFNNTGDRNKILNILSWGSNVWTSMASAFYGCENLTITATDQPNLSIVTNMSNMFRGALVFNQNINSWNTSNVTTMSAMFMGATAFNQPIGSWNTAAVVNMFNMFRDAIAFNQNIGSWNTGAVTNMTNLFFGAAAFNQNISSWNTAAVTSMAQTFRTAVAFNQNIGSWNTGAVTSMNATFMGATVFNQNIGSWKR